MALRVEQQQYTIAGDAELCLHSFQHCLQQSASIHPRCTSLVEDQLARFSVWTANIGVFAPGRASMDHRLREVPDVQDIVRGILDVLDDRIQNCSAVLKALDNLHPGKSGVAEVVENENLDRSVRAIANEISLLHRLLNTIRRASKHSQSVKAIKLFQIKDDEGNDAEPFLQEVFASYIYDRFKGIGEAIRQRLASTMLLRRKRILYRRSRYGQAPIKPKKTISQPTVTLPLVQQQAAGALEQPRRPDAPEVAAESTQTIVQSLAVTATTLAPDSFKKASAPSIISVSKTVSLGDHQDLIFPPAPTGCIKQKYKQLKKQRKEGHTAYLESLRRSLDAGIKGSSPKLLSEFHQETSDAEAKLQNTLDKDWDSCIRAIVEVTCPFCFYTLPSLDVVDEKKWKSHVRDDLDAYVCLFEECDTPEELYNHSDEWLKHMRVHALRWRCNSKSHDVRVFVTRDDYMDHISKVHKGAFTEAQLRVLAERNSRTIGPLFESCPLCGAEEVKGLMEDHIVGHLRSIALKSLPAYQDGGSESSRSEGGSLGTSGPPSRTTIKMDPERYLKPTFDDEVSSALKPSMDPSTDSVEESLFVGVLKSDQRRFEWGFVTDAHGSSQSIENDSIIQSLLKHQHKRLSQGSRPTIQRRSSLSSATSGTINEQRGVVFDGDLQNASLGGREAVVEQLLFDKGADINAKRGKRNNVFQTAGTKSTEAIIQLLFNKREI
ncbi:hypothetical protein G7Y89_g12090 [Cudoniella acicularis]|uniref:Uncharacterized protein n=1 Tax=Cudoniella acicularis TaxID=354080 RepID=A0A8H4RB43_9HELO|nr:hypothetical protein G7Y89_g12090 [Cudoniella acicularis]